jgi:hypothetical protein
MVVSPTSPNILRARSGVFGQLSTALFGAPTAAQVCLSLPL